MPDRRDYLGECNDQNTPLQDFKMMFCDRCVQRECSRSKFGTSTFDKRVASWQERYFSELSKMKESDPRFLPLANANFKMYVPAVPSPSSSNSRSAWLDPRDIPDAAPESPTTFASEPPPQTPSPVLSSPAQEVAPAPPPLEKSRTSGTSPPQVGVRNLPHSLLLMNTQAASTTLPGAPKALPRDPWAAPALAEGDNPPAAPVVQKGARIKFGGSGVE